MKGHISITIQDKLTGKHKTAVLYPDDTTNVAEKLEVISKRQHAEVGVKPAMQALSPEMARIALVDVIQHTGSIDVVKGQGILVLTMSADGIHNVEKLEDIGKWLPCVLKEDDFGELGPEQTAMVEAVLGRLQTSGRVDRRLH